MGPAAFGRVVFSLSLSVSVVSKWSLAGTVELARERQRMVAHSLIELRGNRERNGMKWSGVGCGVGCGVGRGIGAGG